MTQQTGTIRDGAREAEAAVAAETEALAAEALTADPLVLTPQPGRSERLTDVAPIDPSSPPILSAEHFLALGARLPAASSLLGWVEDDAAVSKAVTAEFAALQAISDAVEEGVEYVEAYFAKVQKHEGSIAARIADPRAKLVPAPDLSEASAEARVISGRIGNLIGAHARAVADLDALIGAALPKARAKVTQALSEVSYEAISLAERVDDVVERDSYLRSVLGAIDGPELASFRDGVLATHSDDAIRAGVRRAGRHLGIAETLRLAVTSPGNVLYLALDPQSWTTNGNGLPAMTSGLPTVTP